MLRKTALYGLVFWLSACGVDPEGGQPAVIGDDSADLVQSAAALAPVQPMALGSLRVGNNYTDLGLTYRNGNVVDVYMPRDLATLRNVVRGDIARIANAGIIDLRIWAETTDTGGDVAFMSNRVGIIADEAAARGVQVTVSLFDAHRTDPSQPDTQNSGIDGILLDRYQRIVCPNAGKTNVVWSIGNEIAGFRDPPAFAAWYRSQVNTLRATCGQVRVVAELVPGSVNHFEWDGRADQAARDIINASNLVAVHYYGTGSESDLEFRSLIGWLNRAGPDKFVVGEIGFCTDTDTQTTDRYPTMRGALVALRDRGVRTARIWQFLKDEGGHVDRCSFETFRWTDITPLLVQDGFLPGGTPPPSCNTGSYPSGSWNACIFDGTNMNSYVASESWPSVNFDWGNGGPQGRTNNFSVEARTTVCFSAGTYRFHTLSDDGVELYVNGSPVIQNWTDHGPTQDDSGAMFLSSCVQLRARFYERGGGAVFKVWWDGGGATCPCSSNPAINNFCHYPPRTSGCAMTFPGGYCDPNGDGSYADADWNLGYYEYAGACPR